MRNFRLMPPPYPPASLQVNPMTFNAQAPGNDRTYSCAIGSTIDVQEADASVMMANGWICCASGGVGPSSQRPKEPARIGEPFIDTTLGKIVAWDGQGWRDPVTGQTA